MHYQGQERRQHQVLITHNTEYHMRGDRCVAVRDVRTGALQVEHEALGGSVLGQLELYRGCWRLAPGTTPAVGRRVLFDSHLVTSPVQVVSRPRRHAPR